MTPDRWLVATYGVVGIAVALCVLGLADPDLWWPLPGPDSGNFTIGAWLVAAVLFWPVLIVLTMLTGLGWLARKVVGG
jgi:hypothetical protein